ncbi:MAG: PQQ-binding-like beta-propeller repeat protein [Acidobacteriota bacterium]|nr:PQQ-binding-like beta-propeller repeat protein [Acidobacteriota bacterium]
MSFLRRAGVGIACSWAAVCPVYSADNANWGQWRGPTRDGQAAVFGTVESWPDAAIVVWSVEAGEGQSSPLAVGDRVVLFDREEGSERTRALDVGSGKVLWSEREPVRFRPGMGGGRFGAGPKSTPAVADGRVVTYGVTSLLTVRDLATGRVVWRKDPRVEGVKPTLYWGNAVSPIVVDGRVIVHFGKAGKGGVRAYDLADGRERWRVEEFGTSYSSPIVIGVGEAAILGVMTGEGPVGLSRDGKVLWQIDFEQTFTRQNTPTPVVAGGLLVYGGESRPLFAHRVERRGAGWNTAPAWTRDDVSLGLASTVVVDGRVCGFSSKRKGQLFCLDAATGADVWLGPGRAGEHTALLVVPGYLLAIGDEGVLRVLDRAGSAYRQVAEYEIAASPVFAHPAVVERGLVIKSHDRLELLSFAGGE